MRRAAVTGVALIAALLTQPARPSGAAAAVAYERPGSSHVDHRPDATTFAMARPRSQFSALEGPLAPSGPTASLATYLGSELADGIVAIEIDAADNVFVFGKVPDAATLFAYSPTQFGSDVQVDGTDDCYLAKLVPHRSVGTLDPVYVARIHQTEQCQAMSVTPLGEVYIARTVKADGAVVIERFDHDPTTGVLQRTSSFALPHLARVTHLRVDDGGNSYVVGECANESDSDPSAPFPSRLWPLPNGFQPRPESLNPRCADTANAGGNGGQYLMVKADPQGQVLYGSFFGFDTSQLTPNSVELDGLGRLFIAGDTQGWPTILHTPNALMLQSGDAFCAQNTPGCAPGDAFLIVFDPRFQGNASYPYASYIGGQNRESAVAMALDGDGRVHLIGNTQSQTSFPGIAFSMPTAIYGLVLDVDQAPANQIYRSRTIVEDFDTIVLPPHLSAARFRLRPNGSYAFLTLGDATSPLVEPLYDAPRDPFASVELQARLQVYSPATHEIVFSTYLDDVTVAHSAHLASAPGGTLYVGMLTIEAGRSTSSAFIAQDDVLVLAIDGIESTVNHPPVANAGGDRTLFSSSPAGTKVLLYGGLSFDQDGDPLSYEWKDGPANVISTESIFEVVLTPGDHFITLTVTDGNGGSDSDAIVVRVLPNTPTAAQPQTVTAEDDAWKNFGIYSRFPMTVEFPAVTAPGFTWVTSRYELPPVPPPGMQFGTPPFVYELRTTASFTGPVQVCLDYRGMSFATPDQNLGIWQRVNGTWTQLPGTNDTAARRICAPTPAPIAPANPATFGLFTPAVAANEISLLAGQPSFTPSCRIDQGLDPNEGGFATASSLCNTRGLAYDAARNYLYFAEAGGGDAIRRIDLASGRITTVAGTGYLPGTFDGFGRDLRDDDQNNVDPRTAPVNQVLALALDPAGNLLVGEYGAGRIRKIDFAQNRMFTVATLGNVFQPSAMAIDSSGALLFASFAADPYIRRLTPGADGVLDGSVDETIQIVAGNGGQGFDPALVPSGGADPRQVPVPVSALAFGPGGSLYVTGSQGAVLRITPGPDGLIDGSSDTAFLVAGGAFTSEPILGDGNPATSARLFIPISIAVASNGDVYVGDTGNPSGATIRRIRAVDGVVTGEPDEIISTIAGFHIFDEAFSQGTDLPYSDGDGHALSSIFGASFDLLFLPNGDLLVNDFWQIRRIGPRNPTTDTTPPVLTLPGLTYVEAQSASGAIVTFTATATDAVDGNVPVVCTPGSGSIFPFSATSDQDPQRGGYQTSTAVTCTATDAAGNTSTGGFEVVVEDTTAPAVTITGPSSLVLAATEMTGARANTARRPARFPYEQFDDLSLYPETQAFQALLAGGTATDAVDPAPQRLPAERVDCFNPATVLGPAGHDTLFPLGRSCVRLPFHDRSGNLGYAVATIDVVPPVGGHVNAPNIPVTATDMNNVPQPVAGNFVVLQQPGLLTAAAMSPGAQPPAGVTFTSPVFDVRSTARPFPGAVSVCITTPGAQAGDKLYRLEGGTWLDMTASVDVATSNVCGLPAPLGIFATGRSLIAVIEIAERIVISDTVTVVPSAMIGVAENILVSDTPAWLPPVSIDVVETIVVSDSVSVAPAAMIAVAETIVVTDTLSVSAANTPPVVDAGPDQIVEATSAAGASVTVTGTATDLDGDALTLTWSSPCGGATGVSATLACALGSHTITFRADDGRGGIVSDTVTVTVRDTTPPVLTLPDDFFATPTSPAGAVVSFSATAIDTVSGAIVPVCSHASGSTFAPGFSTGVTCTATDAAGNQATGTFIVSVLPVAPSPSLSLPGNITATATSLSGAVVNFTATAFVSNIFGAATPVPVFCTPSSGSTFPIGTTTVTCSATNPAGNPIFVTFPTTGSFTVTVLPGMPSVRINVAARGRDTDGSFWVDLRLTNVGTGPAQNINLAAFSLRTLNGVGIVSYNATRTGPLPLVVSSLDTTAAAIVRVYFNVPTAVTRFSITANGTVQNAVGVTGSFSASQTIIP